METQPCRPLPRSRTLPLRAAGVEVRLTWSTAGVATVTRAAIASAAPNVCRHVDPP